MYHQLGGAGPRREALPRRPDDHPDCLDKELDIHRERPRARIFLIHLDYLSKCLELAGGEADLRKPGESGTHLGLIQLQLLLEVGNSGGSGRGPTKLMSPLRMLKN